VLVGHYPLVTALLVNSKPHLAWTLQGEKEDGSGIFLEEAPDPPPHLRRAGSMLGGALGKVSGMGPKSNVYGS
jgi:hypothetical protein